MIFYVLSMRKCLSKFIGGKGVFVLEDLCYYFLYYIFFIIVYCSIFGVYFDILFIFFID